MIHVSCPVACNADYILRAYKNPHLHKAVVPQQQRGAVDPKVEHTVMAGADADPYTACYELQALTPLHPEHAAHSPHHHYAVTAASDGGILQGRQGIDDAVMTVCDAQDAIREIVLPFGYCTFADTLYIHYPTCTYKPHVKPSATAIATAAN